MLGIATTAPGAARPGGAPYDQMMALYPPRRAGTDSYVRIYNNDGSEAGACGNGMRCVATLIAGGGLVAVSNVGDDPFWTGHPFAQANLYAFGRLAWNPALSRIDAVKEFTDDGLHALTTRPAMRRYFSLLARAAISQGWSTSQPRAQLQFRTSSCSTTPCWIRPISTIPATSSFTAKTPL